MSDRSTQPIGDAARDQNRHLTVAASWTDPTTGATYVHADLQERLAPWEAAAHVPPMKGCEQFGDVDSFVGYVSRFGKSASSYLSWNGKGLKAVLDFADSVTGDPGRGQWSALMPFRPALQWAAWMSFANGSALAQKAAVEKLEDLAGDIVEPGASELMALLRGLRGTVNASADAELRADGTSKVSFSRDTKVQTTSTSIELPGSFWVAIPVLKGHVDPEGRPVVYRVEVRLRVAVDDPGKLTLRFSVPLAERILEDVYAERVAVAQSLLGDGFELLRAAD